MNIKMLSILCWLQKVPVLQGRCKVPSAAVRYTHEVAMYLHRLGHL